MELTLEVTEYTAIVNDADIGSIVVRWDYDLKAWEWYAFDRDDEQFEESLHSFDTPNAALKSAMRTLEIDTDPDEDRHTSFPPTHRP